MKLENEDLQDKVAALQKQLDMYSDNQAYYSNQTSCNVDCERSVSVDHVPEEEEQQEYSLDDTDDCQECIKMHRCMSESLQQTDDTSLRKSIILHK